MDGALARRKAECLNMSLFDPFGDFETAGYLRNRFAKKDPTDIKELEHITFLLQLPSVLDWLQTQPLTYDTLLQVHHKLFCDFYPWAGQDRLLTCPNTTIKKGTILFSNPEEIKQCVLQALEQKKPSYLLTGLAQAHPFLDGNGRAIFVFFAEHQRRQGNLIRFDAIAKSDFNRALGKSILGSPDKLTALLKEITVSFPLVKPDSNRLSRVFSAIDWSGTNQNIPYEAQPTLLHKIIAGFKR